VLTCICDCEAFRGLPRRKDPKIVVLVGGDSFPAPSIQTFVVVVVAEEGLRSMSRGTLREPNVVAADQGPLSGEFQSENGAVRGFSLRTTRPTFEYFRAKLAIIHSLTWYASVDVHTEFLWYRSKCQ